MKRKMLKMKSRTRTLSAPTRQTCSNSTVNTVKLKLEIINENIDAVIVNNSHEKNASIVALNNNNSDDVYDDETLPILPDTIGSDNCAFPQ